VARARATASPPAPLGASYDGRTSDDSLPAPNVLGALSAPQRRCALCGERKPLEAFRRDRRRPSGYGSRCRDCRRRLEYPAAAISRPARRRAQQAREPDYHEAGRIRRRRRQRRELEQRRRALALRNEVVRVTAAELARRTGCRRSVLQTVLVDELARGRVVRVDGHLALVRSAFEPQVLAGLAQLDGDGAQLPPVHGAA
jgi:hypothetical protein